MHYLLGLEVWKGDGDFFMSQGKYSYEILQIFHMENCKPMDTPLAKNQRKESASFGEIVDATIYIHILGSWMYLVNTWPDICYVINQLSQAMVKPTKLYWKEIKHVLRYLRGTTKYRLWYRRKKGVKLKASLMQIRQGVHQTRKILQVLPSMLGLQVFPGIAGNRGYMQHSAQQRLNTWLQFKQHVRPYG